jgi:hypothetical protein
VIALKAGDVALPGDSRLRSLAAIHAGGLHIRDAKTGKHQFCVLRHRVAAEMLRVHLHGKELQHDDRVFTFSADSLRASLQSALRTFGVASVSGRQVVLHSLRHGGATDMLLSGKAIADVLRHGRWRQTASAELYLQSGQALRFDAVIPPDTAALANRVARNPLAAMLAASKAWLQQCLSARQSARGGAGRLRQR